MFADLAGYTRITEEQGDERAARVALRLAELAVDAAREHDGRLVKLLGDGVMLHFASPRDAVDAALDLVEAVDRAGLPSAHIGIDAGRVIVRDGDYFGHTVNLASRISARAGSGDVLVSSAVRDAAAVASEGPAFVFEPIGRAELKGIAEPIELFRASQSMIPGREPADRAGGLPRRVDCTTQGDGRGD